MAIDLSKCYVEISLDPLFTGAAWEAAMTHLHAQAIDGKPLELGAIDGAYHLVTGRKLFVINPVLQVIKTRETSET